MLTLVQAIDLAVLVPLLRDADEGHARIHTVLADPAHTSYVVRDERRDVGAATVRWQDGEIIYIAVLASLRGRGIGKALIEAVVAEARLRGLVALAVGTANSSLANIAFYQKCGFRMDHVRCDYFAYIQPPISEDGILLRDMLVFTMQL